MKIKTSAALTALSLALGLAASAQATVYDLSLSGAAANFVPYSFPNAIAYTQTLSGLDSGNSFTVSDGDTLNVTVTLDQPYTTGTATRYTSVVLALTGSSFPSENVGASVSDFTFFLGSAPVEDYPVGGCGTADQLASCAGVYAPANPAYTWDSFTTSFTITDLAIPATLDGSYFEIFEASNAAIPEPVTWTMLLMGFAAVGAGLRRRRTQAAIAA